MKKPTVFISYSHADSDFVDQLTDRLKASDINVWIDKWMIRVGDSITQKINDGIGTSDFLIIVLSKASVKSKWVQEELNAALVRNVEQDKHAFILPALIERCPLPSLLEHRKYSDFRRDPERAFQELIEVIRPVSLTPSVEQPMVVEPLRGDRVTIKYPIPLTLIRVLAGPFLMGDGKKPVKVGEFYIAKTPITNEQYEAFVKATSYRVPDHWRSGRIPSGKENHPVVYVSFDDVEAFCRWLGEVTSWEIRLPTEEEWEKAARGTDGREYPWGNEEPDATRCNLRSSGIGDTTYVGKYSPKGDSPYGCGDMSGNVLEWTSSLWQGGPSRVVRGGSFDYYEWYARSTTRVSYISINRIDDVGFRVAASPGLSTLLRSGTS